MINAYKLTQFHDGTRRISVTFRRVIRLEAVTRFDDAATCINVRPYCDFGGSVDVT